MKTVTFIASAVFAAASLLSLPAVAKTMPEEYDFDETAQTPAQPTKLKNLGDTRHAPISLRQANRISVKGGRILRFVSDPHLIDIKHDEPTGSLFVIPLTKESTNIFVMTDSGQTHSLVLTPAEKLSGQNLEIVETTSFKYDGGNNHAVSSSLPLEEQVQKIFRNLTSILKEPAETLSLSKIKRDSLEAVPGRYWTTGNDLRLEHWTLKNTSGSTVPVEEARFWNKDIIAVAVDKAALTAGEKADLWIVRRGVHR